MYKFLSILLFAYGLALTTEDIYDDSYALIIGIDKYQNVRSLDYAVKDAEDIQSMLVDKFHFKEDDIVLLKNEEATKASILQEFSNITKKAEANDRVLIFFAGHGVTDDLPDGGEMGYLMPVNGDEQDLYITAIDMDELRKISLLSKAKHILYLVDACYGGIASVGARSLNAKSTPDYLQKITQDKARQMISAGGRGEEVMEKSAWGHSAFTKNLLSGLRDSKADIDNDGIITAQELGAYLKRKVTIDSNNQQTPKTRYLSTDEGEFVFINNVEKIIINEATINIVDTANTINYDILAKKIADELSNSKNGKSDEYLITEQSDKYYRLLISPYLGAGNLPYGIGGIILGYNISKRSQLSLQYQIRGNEDTYPYSQSDYNAINIGVTKFWGNNLNQYVSLGIGLSYLRYVPAENCCIFQQKDRGDMFIEIGTSIKRKTYLNPNISIRIGYSNIDGFIKTEDDIKYNLERGYFMILGHIDLIKL